MSETLRFTCTEKKLVVRNPATKETIATMSEGDTLTLPSELVKLYCERGWGTADGCTTNARKPGNVPLKAKNSQQKVKPQPAPQ